MDSVLFILRGGRVFDEHAVFIMMFKIKKTAVRRKFWYFLKDAGL